MSADKCCNWHSSSHGFTDRQNIGYASRLFEGKQGSGATVTGLDFIENEQDAGFITPLSDGLEISRVRENHSSFCLYRLKYHSCCFPGDGLEVIQIIVIDMPDTGDQWSESTRQLRIRAQAFGTLRTPMVRVAGRDDFVSAGVSLGEFERAFDCF